MIDPDGFVRAIETEPRDTSWGAPQKSKPLHKSLKWGIAGLVLLFIGGSIVSFYVLRGKIVASVASQAQTLQAGVADLQNFDPASAKQKFSLISDSASSTDGFLGTFASFIGGGAFNSFKGIASELAVLSDEFVSLQSGVFNFVATGNGTNFIADLGNLRDTVIALDNDSKQIEAVIGPLGELSPVSINGYLPLKTQLEGAANFLQSFVPWFSASTPRHILVMLQNPSELRPGGGFLGSYADITLAGGNIMDVSVHDVADVDAAFSKNIVPPKALQPEISRFRPADANWFFDFPTSASETINFFESSGLYAQASTTFDTAIAISPKVISDILKISGPISIPGQSTAFTADNFLVEIQKSVQAGQARSATYPKKVLSQLSSALFSQLASSTDEQKQQLFDMALDWIAKKDIMVYSKDPGFESFAAANGASGGVYELPQNWNGDYLAVVNANINGDKSDLAVVQTINLDAQIGSDGTLTDHLSITRAHQGNKSPYWWYQTTNQDYMQVFVPPDSTLQNENGGITKHIVPPVNYAKKGYLIDPLIGAIESSTNSLFGYPAVFSHEESGKKIFSTWSVVTAGKSTELTFDYTRHLFASPANGQKYEFVFEKQPGATGNYKFEINAPLGYAFAENNLPSYTYQGSDPPGRLIIDLTLEKI